MRDVKFILELWGNWSRERLGTDFPSVAAGFSSLLAVEGTIIVCSDADGVLIDSCMAKLKKKKPEEFDLLFDYYLKGISKRGIAKKLRCDEKLVRIKIRVAESFIEGSLMTLNFKF